MIDIFPFSTKAPNRLRVMQDNFLLLIFGVFSFCLPERINASSTGLTILVLFAPALSGYKPAIDIHHRGR
jgi:hypothetical protein